MSSPVRCLVRVATLGLAVVTCLVLAPPAGAGHGDHHTGAGVQGNQLFVDGHVQQSGPSGGTTTIASGAAGAWHHESACDFGGTTLCHDVKLCRDGSVMTYWWFETAQGDVTTSYFYCPETGPLAQPQVSPGMVLRALRRIDLPASELMVQPPGGQTLVNLETIA